MVHVATDFSLLILYNLACALGVIIAVNRTIVSELILSIMYVPFLSVFYFLIHRRLYKTLRMYCIYAYYAYTGGSLLCFAISAVGCVGPKMSGFMGIMWAQCASGQSTDRNDYPNVTINAMCYANGIMFGISAVFQLVHFIYVRIQISLAGGMRMLAEASGNRTRARLQTAA